MAIKGTKIEINDKEYTFAPLTLGAIEAFEDDLSTFSSMTQRKQVGFAIELALSSLRRNYPAMTRDEVSELLDLGNMVPIIAAIASVSNLIAKEGQEGDAQGK